MFNFFHKSSKENNHEEQHQENSNPSPGAYASPASSFSFISGSQNTTDSTSSPALFGGMSVSSATPTEEPQAETSSGFSFMSSTSEVPVDPVVNDNDAPSSFSFMASENTSQTYHSEEPDLLSLDHSHSVQTIPQDLKLNKVASAKAVKKKKRLTRVGFAREDEGEDEPVVTKGDSLPSVPEQSYQPTQELPPRPQYVPEPTPQIIPQNHEESYPTESAEPTSSFSFMQSSQQVEEPVVETEQQYYPTSEEIPRPPGYRPEVPQPEEVEQPQVEVPSNIVYEESPLAFIHQHPSSPVPPAPIVEEPIVVPTKESEVPSADNNNTVSFELPPSVRKNLNLIDQELTKALHGLHQSYVSANFNYAQLLKDMSEITQKCVTLTSKIQSLEAKQILLAEQEEFELAEQMNIEIEELQNLMKQQQLIKDHILQQIQKIKVQYFQEKTSNINILDHTINQLIHYSSDTDKKIVRIQHELQQYEAEEITRYNIEQQRIDLEKAHCLREKETLTAENQVIEDAIKSQMGDFYDKRDHYQSEIYRVQFEIAELEKQLLLKKQEEIEFTKQLSSIELKINEIRKKYDRQLVRIQERLDALEKTQNECLQEETIIIETRQQIETMVKQNKLSLQEIQELLSIRSSEVMMTKDVFLSEIVHTLSPTSTIVHELTPLQIDFLWYLAFASEEVVSQFTSTNFMISMKESSKYIRKEIDDTNTKLIAIRLTMDDLRLQSEVYISKQNTILEQIERSEIAKKMHASNKRFKEAGQCAKEIKDFTEQKEELDKQIYAIYEKMNVEQQQLEQIEIALSQFKEQLQAEEKEEKTILINTFTQRIYQIRKQIHILHKLYNKNQHVLVTENGQVDSRYQIYLLLLEVYQSELSQLLDIRQQICTYCGIEIPIDLVIEDSMPIIAEGEENEDPTPASEALNDGDESSPPAIREPSAEDLENDVEQLVIEEKEQPLLETVDVVTPIDSTPVVEETEATEPEAVVEEVIPQISKEELEQQIAELEVAMDKAAEEEDYDQAATLFEEISGLKEQLEKLA